MLNEKTTSANNLRNQTSRRHEIRNLRAKVRSILPEEVCHKESKRVHKYPKYDWFLRVDWASERDSKHFEKDKRLVKQLQKLTANELEKISENKYYFLGNEQTIEQFDHFVKEFHPKIKQNAWASPKVKRTGDLPLDFIPPFYSQQKGSRKSLTSAKKRGSTATSVHLQKYQWAIHREIKSQLKSYREYENNFNQRKQVIQEQLKVKRQINSMHLQRQQHIAEVNRNSLLKLKIQKAKNTLSSAKFQKFKQKCGLKVAFEENDVLSLTAKLRKICLKRYKSNVTNE